MRIFYDYASLPSTAQNAAIAIGNFDGVHLGHRQVIGEAGSIAKNAGVPWGVLTFEPHPRSLFRPDDSPFRLTPFAAKARLIAQLGVDFVLCLRFDKDFAAQAAQSFVNDVIIEGMAAHHVVSGYDFVFGQGRRGNCELLLSMGAAEGFGFTCVPPVKDDAGQPYSSTRVRQALAAGDPHEAEAVLGRPFVIEGEVLHGDGRGASVGFPTANLALGEYLRPRHGVYAVEVQIAKDDSQAKWRPGVANLGCRPTVSDAAVPSLETFLFDFDGDLYGRHLRVALRHFLRPEQKFSGLDALVAQIQRDCEQARGILAKLEGI